ncbi:crossover junction endodeoxyribonuclease RuvC [Candidatus Oscillochloris fontis]|uniref:crossover junction endodeoxyribonuclease RuvC n=1 Tax=Candidatus Oscillochloris fontis TaxID=2496868 RepID=UPI00101C1944|nr:crossover junction endodeoxyribonuclease RuvC [Candidatus Oscillochloris fontis]
MRTIGIDPGTARMGWGVVEKQGGEVRLVEFGVLTTPTGMPQAERLHKLYTELVQIIQRLQPQAGAVEELFFGKNVNTAITVGQARGVVLLALQQAGLSIHEYKPLVVKQALTGYGGADKRQMQEMVRITLGLTSIPRPDDAADALAIAICHAYTNRVF